MPTYVRTTKKYICDPRLRCRPPTFDDDKEIVFTKRRAYEKSSIELPAPWSWKMLQGMASSLSANVQKSKFDLADSRDRIPYFPFCEELYASLPQASLSATGSTVLVRTASHLPIPTSSPVVVQTPTYSSFLTPKYP